ncbi:MAG: hypothetical protein K0Q73_7483 [Paenibacillus sp.]|jgi:hypothetical protein|nr:hypothetical protein [Paenibacillus sp.]
MTLTRGMLEAVQSDRPAPRFMGGIKRGSQS